MKTANPQITLDSLPVGSRLVVRSKTDWRFASVSKYTDEKIVLTVCSPGGRTYRLRSNRDAKLSSIGTIPILSSDHSDQWIDNFGSYDQRW